MPQYIVKMWTDYTHINQISFQFEPIFRHCLLYIKSCWLDCYIIVQRCLGTQSLSSVKQQLEREKIAEKFVKL